MKTWDKRPQEVANLLNPAFCARVICSCIQGHAAEDNRPMPYALGFRVLPIVLHPSTRATMQGSTRHFQVWLNANEHIKLGLASRTRTLVPHAREAFTFLWQTRMIAVRQPDASLVITKRLRRSPRGGFPVSVDTSDCLSKAALLGKWFARINSPTTIYASLGLMP